MPNSKLGNFLLYLFIREEFLLYMYSRYISLIMVEQITKGIKISVRTKYANTIVHASKTYHVFNYFITIENTSSEIVQLTHRQWFILDALNSPKIVEGEGVVGQMPILIPQDQYTYQSSCVLSSNTGAMRGFFTMKNLEKDTIFKVVIPTFQLTTLPLSN